MRGFSEHKASALALVAANLLPLFGVILFGWDAFAVVALYWIENVVIGAINVLKMITCAPQRPVMDWLRQGEANTPADVKSALKQFGDAPNVAKIANHGSKLFLVPFFAFHYGFFCYVHGAFVLALFGQDTFIGGPVDELREFARVLSEQHLWWAVIALAASHLVSFFINFLGQGEYQRTATPFLMMQPYSRIFVLHIAILFGAFIAAAFGSNVGILAILIAGKTILDLKLHLRERERNAAGKPANLPEGVLHEAPLQ